MRDDWVDQGPAGAPEMQTVGALNLTAGTPYSIRMEVYENAGGEAAQLYWQPPGAASPVVVPSTVLSPPPGPNPPVLTAVQNGFNPQVDVSWSDLGAGVTYDLQRSINAGAFADVVTGTSQLNHADTNGLNFGMSVCYRIRATQNLLTGPYSTPACVTLQFPPPRTNDHDEGLFDDRCSCGSSIPAASGAGASLLAALLLASALRRRR